MKAYSSNYCTKNNNYIININLKTNKLKDLKLYSTYCVIQNIIQRGNPTFLSKFLLDKFPNYKEELVENLRYISLKTPVWAYTIKGNCENNDNPARIFFEEILEKELGDYKFVKNLILPEASFRNITGEERRSYYENAVDFYLPQCKIAIEIDGIQHNENIQRFKDSERDAFLKEKDIKVMRIPVYKIKAYVNGDKSSLKDFFQEFISLCSASKEIENYKNSIEYLMKKGINEDFLKLDGIMRFQNLILELLKGSILDIEASQWIFNIKNQDVKVPYEIAILDLFNWLQHLLNMQGKTFTKPKLIINIVEDFTNSHEGVNIDFSLFKRWDDTIFKEGVSFVRADYFDEKNYYKVATGELIKYDIKLEGDESKIESLSSITENLFGFSSFNDGQLSIIVNALSLKDTIGLLPTGGGKSLCYQLSSMLQPTINFVVVPIKSLMYDQKENLDKKGIVQTAYISSDQSANEKECLINEFGNAKYQCIWISPERFQNENFRKELAKINTSYNIGYAVIDEVHCLSEWGHDFRTSYLNLVKTIRRACPASIFIGLTATASKNVLKDILVEFEVDESNVKTILDYTRKELTFKVIGDKENNSQDKRNNLEELLNSLNNKEKVFQYEGENSKCGIIFTLHVNGNYGCYKLYQDLDNKPMLKGKVQYYAGDVPKIKGKAIMPIEKFNEHKILAQKSFMNNESLLLLSTKAFGMGVDKSNVRYTIHYGLPSSIESFYQEAGRAGRFN